MRHGGFQITDPTHVRCRFLPEDQTITTELGTTILDAAHAHDIPVETVCAGKGTCGTCRVLVRDVEAPDATPHDKRRLAVTQLANGWRLACQHPVQHGGLYTHPRGIRAVRVVESAGLGRISLDPNVQKIYVKPDAPSVHDHRADWTHIQEQLAAVAGDLEPTLEALTRLALIGDAIPAGVTVVIAGNRVISIEPGKTADESFGLAFDIGTTTVVGALMDLNTGQEIAVASAINGQHIYGGDVISRMSVTMRGAEYVDRLHRAILNTVSTITSECLKSASVPAERIYEITFVGNTVMTHLLLGIDPSRISYSPFAPTTVDPVALTAFELALPVLPSASVWVAPAVASYVGGDIVGTVLSTDMGRRRNTTLAIDVGTNGEIVLAHQGKLYATAAPAGPAFEGAEITRGMRATPGAIERVRITPLDIELDVIGGDDPIGICGSGLVDAVAALLRVGAVLPNGRLLTQKEMQDALPRLASRVRDDDTGGEFVLAGDPTVEDQSIALHAQDIRQLQLAKGSIRCGINILLREAGLTAADLDRVVLAGAFGSYIDPANALAIGMLPPVPLDAVHAVGNAAGHGARMCLLSLASRVRATDLPGRIHYVELSAVHDFQDHFAQAMQFEQRP